MTLVATVAGRRAAPHLHPVMVVAIAAIALCGAVLRLAAARGDLWLDEIWSFRLLDLIHTPRDIVLALPYDTNHVLTTLWLALVGPAAPPLLVRLPAVIFGSLCVPVAARIGARRGPVAALAAAVIVAVDYVFVHYGSEARGYAGMILATLVALDALETWLDERSSNAVLTAFAVAIAFGTFSHLTMVEPTAVLCATAAVSLGREAGWSRTTASAVAKVVAAATIGTVPALACFAFSVLSTGSLHTGIYTPPSPTAFIDGFGRLLGATVGLPDGSLDRTGAALLMLAVAAGSVVMLAIIAPSRRVLPAICLAALPPLHAMMPNQSYPRFYLTVAIALAVLGADAFAAAWRRGTLPRSIATTLAAGFLVGQSALLTTFLIRQRGHYADAVALLSRSAPATFTVLPRIQAGETNATIQWFARAQASGARLKQVGALEACNVRPDWLIMTHVPDEAIHDPPVKTAGPAACPTRFLKRQTLAASGFSGSTWTLYQRAD